MSGETESNVSGWTVDALRVHLEGALGDLKGKLDERYETQTKAVDAAFVAQQTAMTVALAAAERAVATALLAAEKATVKAENAADKRFDAVNEFRGQLADQANTFMPRSEAEAAIGRNTERLQELALLAQMHVTKSEMDMQVKGLSERYQELSRWVSTDTGRTSGIQSTWLVLVTVLSLTTTVIALIWGISH
jgi:hypothetical protein